MRKRNLLIVFVLILLGSMSGCFKEVGYNTFLLVKAWVKEGNSNAVPLEGGVLAYAFAADTAGWDVLSYEDAVRGVITSRTDSRTQQPVAQGGSFVFDGDNMLGMHLNGPYFLLLVVDLENRLYGFTDQAIGENLSEMFVNVTFFPKDAGKRYIKSMSSKKWIMCNDFYEEPEPEPELNE
ncbi:hypothetical protein [uncultured Alistipes sp.]|uniref:hypothetical protein n=1 Tax=uncultured Alistipes sp. TaxID=538949 RepID=UPI00260B6051|nr:hypothetical protein [uncultured Alistipes sp.]